MPDDLELKAQRQNAVLERSDLQTPIPIIYNAFCKRSCEGGPNQKAFKENSSVPLTAPTQVRSGWRTGTCLHLGEGGWTMTCRPHAASAATSTLISPLLAEPLTETYLRPAGRGRAKRRTSPRPESERKSRTSRPRGVESEVLRTGEAALRPDLATATSLLRGGDRPNLRPQLSRRLCQ
jgi:hypothetical protein